MTTVKCNICGNELEGYCKIKKTSIKPNKARQCESYNFDSTKVKTAIPIYTELRPDWYWNRKEVINKAKKELKKIEEGRKINPQYIGNMPRSSMEHPLTGDLSRFVSTGAKEN